MSNGNGPERECAVVWRNMGGPVLTGKAVSVRLSPIPTSPSKKSPLTGGFFTWRKWWDSNPRARKGYLISRGNTVNKMLYISTQCFVSQSGFSFIYQGLRRFALFLVIFYYCVLSFGLITNL